jgi:ribonuclease III
VASEPEGREGLLRALEERLGHRFAEPSLLDRALTHTSRANESLSGTRHNEPLEFLGDAVLGFIVSDLLHRRDPEGDEGTKSKTRALLVAEPSLARRAEELGIPELLRLGRGEEKSGGRQKATLWADAYEAVVAALYLDGGLAAAQRFVAAEFARELEAGAGLATQDAKSALQEALQARGADVPEYRVVAEEGPGHRRRFRVACVIVGRVVAEGDGFSKKEAQQDAARRALEAIANDR